MEHNYHCAKNEAFLKIPLVLSKINGQLTFLFVETANMIIVNSAFFFADKVENN